MKFDRHLAKAFLGFTSGAVLAASIIVTPARSQTYQSQTDTAAQAIAIAGGGGTSAGGTQRIVTAPPISAPSVFGANPCSVGGSGGGSWLGTGIVFGASFDGSECRLQEWFRMLNMGGLPEVARAMVCRENPRVREAFREAGVPCLAEDRARVLVALPAPQQVAARAVRPAYCSVPGIANSECH